MSAAAVPTDQQQQALTALARAETRFLAGDVAGARGLAHFALSLSPGLPAAAQAAAAYDVLAARDWYAALGLPHPLATGAAVTHDAVRRQHRRLCLLVHPDKNSSAAADAAFKRVQAAYDALSAAHPPAPAPVRPATASRPTPPAAARSPHPLWEEEQDQPRYCQPAGFTMPGADEKQPPVGRPSQRRADPPPQRAGRNCPSCMFGEMVCAVCSASGLRFGASSAGGDEAQGRRGSYAI